MPKPKQCRLIGGISVVLGIAVIVVSALLLNILAHKGCFDRHEAPFEYHGDDGDIHGGNKGHGGPFPKTQYFAAFKQGKYGHQDHDIDSEYKKTEYYCHSVPTKLKACAGTGIAAGIVQILISAIYCFSKKKTVKLFSGLWAVVHVLVMVALVAAFSVVLSLHWPKDKDTKYDGLKRIQPKALAFSAVAGLDVVVLILLMIFVVTTFKKSDYDDYSVGYEKDEHQHVVASK